MICSLTVERQAVNLKGVGSNPTRSANKNKERDKNMKITIQTTKTGIAKGESTHDGCPIARALRAKGFKNVSVDVMEIYADRGHDNYMCFTPKNIVKYINRFDGHEKVKPQKFTLDFEVIGTP